MVRKLATIQTIVKLEVHPNADKLEIAHVKGWSCVVIKDSFTEGEKIVFIEPDAILPEGRPEWEFMRERGFRIKTIKLRKILSQGLVFNAHSLLADKYLPLCEQLGTSPLPDETDVTDLLGIQKYEPYVPANLSGTVKGNFPEFLHKTDEERVNNIPDILEKYKGTELFMSEKLDGTSCSIFMNNGEFGVCSRNLELKETEGNTFWKIARELRIEQALRGCGNYAIQGEILGQGIQSNKYNMSGVEFRVFNVYDINARKYLDFEDFKRFVAAIRLETVPLLGTIILNHTTDQILELVKGNSVLNKNTLREGVVFRPVIERHDSYLGRLSFKGINSDFLLQYGE